LPVTAGGTASTSLTGIQYWNGTSAPTAATSAQVVSLINSTAVTNATNATNVAITDDTTTNSDYYVTFVSASSGNTGMKTSSTKLKYHPSTGALTASTIYIAP